MSEQRDERAFKAELEIKTPAWFPGVRIATSFQRLWDKRAEDYTYKMAGLAEIEVDELRNRLDKDDGFSDLFYEGGRRFVESGDEVLRDAVTRLVAAALRDDARILDASYFMKKLSMFDALHIRIIYALPKEFPILPESATQDYGKEKKKMRIPDEWRSVALRLDVDSLVERCRASKSLVRAVLSELATSGFVREVDRSEIRAVESDALKMLNEVFDTLLDRHMFVLSDLGRDFRCLIETIDSESMELDD